MWPFKCCKNKRAPLNEDGPILATPQELREIARLNIKIRNRDALREFVQAARSRSVMGVTFCDTKNYTIARFLRRKGYSFTVNNYMRRASSDEYYLFGRTEIEVNAYTVSWGKNEKV